MKKALSVLLSLCLILSICSVGVFAAEKTYETPASSYASYERNEVAGNNKAYIDSMSYDMIAGVLLDWVDRKIAEVTADFETFEVEAFGTTIALEIPDISSIDKLLAYSEYISQLGGDFQNLDVSSLSNLKRANGDINFIYGIIEFIAQNARTFGKVFHWEEGKVFDYGKLGEYILALDTTDPENKKIVDFYNNYFIGNDIQEKFISGIAKEMNYTVPTAENGERAESFDSTISNGIINWFSGIIADAGLLSEEGLLTLKTYDLRTTDIYALVKNFVALVQSDNQVKIDTYYNFLLDTTVRTLLKTMLGKKAAIGAAAENADVIKTEFAAKYTDLSLLFELSGGNAFYKAEDGTYYAVTLTSEEIAAVNTLTWEDAINLNFTPPVVNMYTGAGFATLVQTYKPTNENFTIGIYASQKNQDLLKDSVDPTLFAGTEVPAVAKEIMVEQNAKAFTDGVKIETILNGETTALELSFAEIEEYAEAQALPKAQEIFNQAVVAAEQSLGAFLPNSKLDVTLDAIDVTVGYNGYATEDDFIAEAYLQDVGYTLGGSMASLAEQYLKTLDVDALVNEKVAAIMDTPIATIVVDELTGGDFEDAKALFDYIDTDFVINENLLDVSANYDTYNGVVGQANHILVGLVNMFVSDSGEADLALKDGGNENITDNLQKICDKTNAILTKAKEVLDEQGFKDFIAGTGVNDMFASSHGFNAEMIYNLDFSSVENLMVCAIEVVLDFIDDETPGLVNDIHEAVEGLETLDAMAVALTDYVLEKCIPDVNAKLGTIFTVPAATVAASVKNGEAKDIILTKLVDLAYEVSVWAVEDLLNGVLNNVIASFNEETDLAIPDVTFALGVEKGANWEETLAALVDRVYELADGIIIACSYEGDNTFDKISAVMNDILPLGSLLSNCKNEEFALDVDKVVNTYIFAEALNGDFSNFLGLFETAEKTEDVAAGVPVTMALIKASEHIVDSIFPDTIKAETYTASETVQEEFTSGDNDVVIAANNMVSINARKTHIVPAVLDLIRISGLLPYFAACDHKSGNTTQTAEIPATCITDGITASVKCADCGYTVSGGLVIPKNSNHTNIVDVAAVDATCTQNGSTAGKKCADCGTVTEGCAVILASHTAVRPIEAVAPTCISTGFTAGEYCDACDTIISGHSDVPATGHIDENEDNSCDNCGAEIEAKNFFDKILDFFRRIIDWFKNLFN